MRDTLADGGGKQNGCYSLATKTLADETRPTANSPTSFATHNASFSRAERSEGTAPEQREGAASAGSDSYASRALHMDKPLNSEYRKSEWHDGCKRKGKVC